MQGSKAATAASATGSSDVMHSASEVADSARRKSRGRRRGFGISMIAAAAMSLATLPPLFLLPLVAQPLIKSVAAVPHPMPEATPLPPPLVMDAPTRQLRPRELTFVAAKLEKREATQEAKPEVEHKAEFQLEQEDSTTKRGAPNHGGVVDSQQGEELSAAAAVGPAAIDEAEGTYGPVAASDAEKAALEAQLAEKQKEWEEGRATISVSKDSRPHKTNVDIDLDTTSRPKVKPGVAPPKVGIPPTLGQLGYHIPNPFRSAEIGLTGKSHRSLGLYNKNYPFTDRSRHLRGDSKQERAERMRAEMRMPEHQAYESMFKHGWSRWQLDDDGKLATPDERRRPRGESAARRAAVLFRKPWWRWTPGEGWVFASKKDLGPYTRGPGIALANLAPPKERLAVPRLPLIPNSSKRVLVEMIIAWIVALTLVALYFEVRAEWRRQAKGKGVARDAPYQGSSTMFVSADPNRSRPLHSRQRSKASLLRGFWQSALASGASTADRSAKRIQRALTINVGIRKVSDEALREDGLPTSGIELLEKGALRSDDVVSPIASGSGSGSVYRPTKASLSPPVSAISLPDDDGYWTSGTGSHSYDLSPRKPGSSRREPSQALSRSSSRSNLQGEDIPTSPLFRARQGATPTSIELPPVITLHTASPGSASPH